LRDRWTTLILLVLPILMIILFGFGITTEIRNTRFAVYDPSGDYTTRAIVNKLESSEYFILERYLKSEDEIEELFRRGETGFAVVFGDNQILLVADGTDPEHRINTYELRDRTYKFVFTGECPYRNRRRSPHNNP